MVALSPSVVSSRDRDVTYLTRRCRRPAVRASPSFRFPSDRPVRGAYPPYVDVDVESRGAAGGGSAPPTIPSRGRLGVRVPVPTATITHQCEEIRVAVLQAGAVGLMRRMRHGFSIVRRARISLTHASRRRRGPTSGSRAVTLARNPRYGGEPRSITRLVHLGGFSLLNGDRKMAAGGDGKQQAQPRRARPLTLTVAAAVPVDGYRRRCCYRCYCRRSRCCCCYHHRHHCCYY